MTDEKRIIYLKQQDVIIVPEALLADIFREIKRSRQLYIQVSIYKSVPPGYISYIAGVINTNRNCPGYCYEYIGNVVIEYSDILMIIVNQLKYLSFAGEKCFTHVFLKQNKDGEPFLHLKYPLSFGEICISNSELVYCDPFSDEKIIDLQGEGI